MSITPYLTRYARDHRKKPTEAEEILWQAIRRKALGSRIRRQVPILHRYIADFYWPTKKLVIEVDGGYHFTDFQQIADQYRTQALRYSGYTVIRFSNTQVLHDLHSVIRTLQTF